MTARDFAPDFDGHNLFAADEADFEAPGQSYLLDFDEADEEARQEVARMTDEEVRQEVEDLQRDLEADWTVDPLQEALEDEAGPLDLEDEVIPLDWDADEVEERMSSSAHQHQAFLEEYRAEFADDDEDGPF